MAPENPKNLRVLLVEDSDQDALLLRYQLEKAGYDITLERVDTHAALSRALTTQHWDIVFSDFSMPQFDGMRALKLVREHDRDLPFIIVSGTIGEERAVNLMKLGAQDYLLKDNTQRLIPAVQRELKDATLRREHRLAQEHIQHLAYFDSLTHLPNRHRLIEDMQQWPDQAPLTLMVINLVNFREINAALGYNKGDQLIREAATRLQVLTLDEADLYHLQGGEFALALRTDDRHKIESMAATALRVLAPHYMSAGFRIHVGARIGIVQSGEGRIEPSLLLQQADVAATIAKHEGKPFEWYELKRDPSSPQRLALLADLHDALTTDQLFLVFQPKIDCRRGIITGSEALLRWRHPEHGFIPPDTFIPMAEQSGLIDDLTRRVVGLAVDQVQSWRKHALTIPVAINISTKNLHNPLLIAEILQGITQQDGGHPIEIEITETALMRDPNRALTALRQLYDTGTRIYIDDFGTGFSSLSYLKKFPIHAIKIDKSFVMDLVRSPDSEAIVRSTIGLAHSLGLKVVAEGVENQETWERLASNDCDEGQGYYFSKPVPADKFEIDISQWSTK